MRSNDLPSLQQHSAETVDALAEELLGILGDRAHDQPLLAAARAVAGFFEASCVLSLFSGPDGARVTPVAYWHRDPVVRSLMGEYVEAVRLVDDEKLLPAVRNGSPLLLSVDQPSELAGLFAGPSSPYFDRAQATSLLVVPLVVDGRVAGCASLGRYRPQRGFNEADRAALEDVLVSVGGALARAAGRRAPGGDPFRAAFDHARTAMAVVEVGSRDTPLLVAANPALGRLLGRSLDELEGAVAARLIHPDDRPAARAHLEQLLRDGPSSYATERRFLRGDGSTVHVHEKGSLVTADGDGPAHVVCQLHDVTVDADTTLTASEAAAILGVSSSTVRRLADGGTLPSVRTSGGHRRFKRFDVDRIAGGARGVPRLHPVPVLEVPLPAVADLLAAAGPQMAVTAGTGIYIEGSPGWFACPHAARTLERWSTELATACRDADEHAAAAATLQLLDEAIAHQAGLAELDAFLGRFAGRLVRNLQHHGIAPANEIMEVRRLVARLRQRALQHLAVP